MNAHNLIKKLNKKMVSRLNNARVLPCDATNEYIMYLIGRFKIKIINQGEFILRLEFDGMQFICYLADKNVRRVGFYHQLLKCN